MVLGAERKGKRQLSSITPQNIKTTWLTVQVKSHYNKNLGKIEII